MKVGKAALAIVVGICLGWLLVPNPAFGLEGKSSESNHTARSTEPDEEPALKKSAINKSASLDHQGKDSLEQDGQTVRSDVPSQCGTNKDGKLNPSKKANTWASRSNKKNTKRSWMLDKYDVNRNGILDPQEMKTLQRDIEARKQLIIKKYDKNRDGKLDQAEKAALWRDLRLQTARTRAILKKYDLNRNGRLDPEEELYRRDREAKYKIILEKQKNGGGQPNESGKTSIKEDAGVQFQSDNPGQ